MAAAVTPTLFIRTSADIHVAHEFTDSAPIAADYIESGKTVVVPDAAVARSVLLLLGLDVDYVESRINTAIHGLSHCHIMDPNSPVPLAPVMPLL
jgi:hypothetical protein